MTSSLVAAQLSDSQLVADVATLLSTPRQEPADSFVLHAPLELAARARLLPHVQPDSRALARDRIAALGVHYEQYPEHHEAGSSIDRDNSADSADSALAGLRSALTGGDVDGAGRAAAAVADRLTGAEASSALTGDLISLTAAAAHAPIFLFHLGRRDPTGGLSIRLLVPLARELARHPDRRIRWVDRAAGQGPTSTAELARALNQMPLLGKPGSSFIHPLLMQVDESGLAEQHLGPVLGTRTPAAATELLRIAAGLMLSDTSAEGPYGWTHCLTIPQAVLGITAKTKHADLGLAIAATQVAAFRVGLGTESMVEDPLDLARYGARYESRPMADPWELASRAATSHDAHVVKYVLACLDAAADDPPGAPLFYAAARRLLEIWVELGGDPSDPLS